MKNLVMKKEVKNPITKSFRLKFQNIKQKDPEYIAFSIFISTQPFSNIMEFAFHEYK